MNILYWLLIAFVILNILDGFTTWLGIYGLPYSIRASEANTFYKDVEKAFWPAMWKKGFFVVFGMLGLLYLTSISTVNILHTLYVLNAVIGIAVLNNLGVYLSRRLTHRKVASPIERVAVLLQKIRIPEKFARRLSFYVVFGLVTVITYLIVGVFV